MTDDLVHRTASAPASTPAPAPAPGRASHGCPDAPGAPGRGGPVGPLPPEAAEEVRARRLGQVLAVHRSPGAGAAGRTEVAVAAMAWGTGAWLGTVGAGPTRSWPGQVAAVLLAMAGAYALGPALRRARLRARPQLLVVLEHGMLHHVPGLRPTTLRWHEAVALRRAWRCGRRARTVVLVSPHGWHITVATAAQRSDGAEALLQAAVCAMTRAGGTVTV